MERVAVFADEGRKMPARVVETNWLMTSAMLMPLERMRVASARRGPSQTQTPDDRIEGHEQKEAQGNQPAVARVRHLADKGFLDFERRGLRASRLPRDS